MTKINNTEKFGKIFGDAIRDNSELKKEYIINAKSLYGGALQKSEDEVVVETFTPDETFAVFYIAHSTSDDTATEEADTLYVYDSFTASIHCYGKDSDILAARLYSRFLTQEILAYFEQNGVHIQSIDNNDDATDFVNGHLVKRRDIVIHFSCEIDTSKKIDNEQFEAMNAVLDVYKTR